MTGSPIVIIDFGMGNLRSVKRAFDKVEAPSVVSSDPRLIDQAEKIVLPGVGAFPECMRNLQRGKLIDPILKAILQDKKPFLGICLGMQVLFEECEEFGPHKGLGILPGKVVRFRLPKKYKIPHMGWNRLKKHHRLPILANVTDGMYVYFVHSYYAVPEDKELVITTTDYGKDFCSSVGRDNIFACQFHPEKSQTVGLEIIRAFAELPSASV